MRNGAQHIPEQRRDRTAWCSTTNHVKFGPATVGTHDQEVSLAAHALSGTAQQVSYSWPLRMKGNGVRDVAPCRVPHTCVTRPLCARTSSSASARYSESSTPVNTKVLPHSPSGWPTGRSCKGTGKHPCSSRRAGGRMCTCKAHLLPKQRWLDIVMSSSCTHAFRHEREGHVILTWQPSNCCIRCGDRSTSCIAECRQFLSCCGGTCFAAAAWRLGGRLCWARLQVCHVQASTQPGNVHFHVEYRQHIPGAGMLGLGTRIALLWPTSIPCVNSSAWDAG